MENDIKNWLENFKNKLHEMGICKGDLLYISSDMTMLMYRCTKAFSLKGKDGKSFFLNSFTDMLKETVGEEGTLLVPVFTWDFCRGIAFDSRTTHGDVGSFGNWLLDNRQDFSRTRHAIYSFMVWGKAAPLLGAMDNRTAWGKDSPFAYLHSNNGKNLLVNVSLEKCFTFTHYVEECIRVPYRYFKDFRGSYTDCNGNVSDRVYTMFVRDLDIESKQVTPDDCLDKAGAAVTDIYDGNSLKLVFLDKAYPCIVENYKHGNANEWYDFDGYSIDWTSGQTHPDETGQYD